MGLPPYAYYLSWSMVLLLELAISCILITAILGPTVYVMSNNGLVFLYFLFFSLSVLSYTFCIAAIFTKGKAAALVAPALFFVAFFPYFAVTGPDYS